MGRRIGIGYQDFEKIRTNNNFYIDKTNFISEWWESGDDVTLLTRPRRFGKTHSDLRAYQRTPTYMLEPKETEDNAMILEFKVQEAEEKELSDTVKDALRQIDEKKYETILVAKGIAKERIRKYGFAFCGKKVLIGSGA